MVEGDQLIHFGAFSLKENESIGEVATAFQGSEPGLSKWAIDFNGF